MPEIEIGIAFDLYCSFMKSMRRQTLLIFLYENQLFRSKLYVALSHISPDIFVSELVTLI